MTTKTKYKDFTLGSDTELVLTDPETKRAVKITEYVDRDADFGADDNSSNFVAEIRSGFSKNPLEVAQSIKNIMQQAINNEPELFSFDWNAGAFIKSVPISFHAHFGHEKNLLKIDDAVTFLDDYVLSLSLLLEDKKQGIKRRAYNLTPAKNEVSYGKLSQYRVVEHSRLSRWEYRPISSTLSSEEICTAFLCLCKIVLFEHINNPHLRYKGYINGEDVITMNTKKIYSLFPNIWSDLQSMMLFPKYKKELQIIHELIKEKQCWTPKGIDIKAAWGLTLDEDLLNKPSFKKIWKDYIVPSEEIKKINKQLNILKTPKDIDSLEKFLVKYDAEPIGLPKKIIGRPIGKVISFEKYLDDNATKYKDNDIDIPKPVSKQPKKPKIVKTKLHPIGLKSGEWTDDGFKWNL